MKYSHFFCKYFQFMDIIIAFNNLFIFENPVMQKELRILYDKYKSIFK